MSDNNATADANDSRPNSSCPVCPQGECLCEIEINDHNSKIDFWYKSKDKLKNENAQRLPNKIINTSKYKGESAKISIDFSEQDVGGNSGQTEEESSKRRDLDFSYNVSGDCDFTKSKCVKTYFIDLTEVLKEHVSTEDENFYSQYIAEVDKKLLDGELEFKPPKGRLRVDYNPDENKQAIVSFGNDGEITYIRKHQPSEMNGVMCFIRGFNFLLFGEINYLPTNVYRFGVITCDGEESNNDFGSEHFTDFFVLPKYEVSFNGRFPLAFTDVGKSDQSGRDDKKSESSSIEVKYEEKINGKMSQSFEFTYKKLNDVAKQEKKDGFWNRINNFVMFINEARKFFGSGDKLSYLKDKAQGEEFASTLDTAANKVTTPDSKNVVLDTKTGKLFVPNKTPLYKPVFLAPVIEFKATAVLESKEGKPHINRVKETQKDEEKEENVISPNGVVNKPNNAGDIALRKKHEAELESESQCYLQFDPFIGGGIAVNILRALGKCPWIGPVITGLDNLLSFDLFGEFSGTELLFDSQEARSGIMEAAATDPLYAKGFCFFSADLSFSPRINFYNNFVDQSGGALELRGSFGLGLALGAMVGVDLIIYNAHYDWQGSYGMRFYFSIDYGTGVVTFWHDGFTSETSKKKVRQVNLGTGGTDNGNNIFKGSYGNNGETVSLGNDGKATITTDLSDAAGGDLEWVDSAYNPEVDYPFDNPFIYIEHKKNYGNKYPNPLSRFFDAKDGSLEQMQKELEAYPEALRKQILKKYNKQFEAFEAQKKRAEGGYWLAPTSKVQPAWTYTLGEVVKNEAKMNGAPLHGASISESTVDTLLHK